MAQGSNPAVTSTFSQTVLNIQLHVFLKEQPIPKFQYENQITDNFNNTEAFL